MKIKTMSKCWTFQVDDQKWKVTYSYTSKYWHVSSQRKSEGQFKDESEPNKNIAVMYLTKVIEAIKNNPDEFTLEIQTEES